MQGGSTRRRAYHCLEFIAGEERKKGDRHDSGHPLPNSSHLLVKFVEPERKHPLCTSISGDVDLVLLTPTKPHHTDEPGVCLADTESQSFSRTGAISLAHRTLPENLATAIHVPTHKSQPLPASQEGARARQAEAASRPHSTHGKNLPKADAASKALVTAS